MKRFKQKQRSVYDCSYYCCSATKLCPTLCYSMDCSTPVSSVLHYLLEFAQTHVHLVSDAIQPSHPLLPLLCLLSVFPSIRVFSNELIFASNGQSIGASALASVLPVNIQGWFRLGLTGLISLQSEGLSRVFSSTIVQNINSLVLSLLYGPILTSIRDYR